MSRRHWKSGGIKPDDVRALNYVREREKAEIGLFISMEQPTPAMVKDAASVGFYESVAAKKFARVQLFTIDGLLHGKQRAEHPDYEPPIRESVILWCIRVRPGHTKNATKTEGALVPSTIQRLGPIPRDL